MKIADIEKSVDRFFNHLNDNASPMLSATVNAARGIVSLGLNIGKETVRKMIESGSYADGINVVRDLAKAGVAKLVPGPFRWVPCVRPGKVVDRIADWLIEQEADIAREVGAKVPQA